jgi:zinc protease
MIGNRIIRLATVVLPLVAGAQASRAQTVAATALPPAGTLLAKYGAAIGGPAYLNPKAIVTKGGMSMPSAGINATFVMTQLAPNQMQMITTIPGMGEVQTGYDGTSAWSMDPMQGPRLLTGQELEQIRDESDRRSSLRASDMFSAVETVSDTTMNSERCYLVKLTWKTGRETYDCYSQTTGLIVASRSVQKTAMGDIPVLTYYSDYKKFGEITVPGKTVLEVMGQQQVFTIESVETGGGEGLVVGPPAAVQALIK